MNDYNLYTLDILKKMITFNTVNEPGNEDHLARFLEIEISSMGFETSVIPCGEGRSSVVAFKGNSKGVRIILNGHLDVVPVSNNWATDPFTMTRSEDRVYGRGTADMKGGMASMLTAVKKLIDENFNFDKGQLILTFVADEELHNLGTRSVLALPNIKNANYAIIGEPTNLDICIGHRGTTRYKIRLHGKHYHSSDPGKGVNAISQMSRLIQMIDKHNEDLKEVKHSILPSPTIAVVMINGGEKDNIIPSTCEIKIDRRTLPSDTKDSIYEEIKALLDSVGQEYEDFSYEIEPYINLEACEISMDSTLVEKASIAYKKCFHKKPILKNFGATCEQSLFVQEGIQTLIYGPGSIQQAHVDNEYTSVSQLYKAVDFYHALIKEVLS
jgi:succinyl-diaminopimelate desuccinylase